MEGKDIDRILMMGEVVSRESYNEGHKQHTVAIDSAGYTYEEFATFWGSFDMIGANQFAKLYTDAHNTVIETGLTPSQLQQELEKAKELLRKVSECRGLIYSAPFLEEDINTYLKANNLK